MDRENKICIWYEPCLHRGPPRQRHKAAYCWSCPLCTKAGRGKGRGRNTFDRFSDWRTDTRHPWQRCVDAVELHIWRYHREDNSKAGSSDS